MKNFCAFLTFILLINLPVVAQRSKIVQKKDTISAAIQAVMSDTLHTKTFMRYWADLDSLQNDTLPMRPYIPRSDYYRLYVPFTYYYSPVERGNHIPWRDEMLTNLEQTARKILPVDSVLFKKTANSMKGVDEVLSNAYKTHSGQVVRTENQIMSKELVKIDIPAKVPSKSPIIKLFTPDKPEEKVVDPELIIRKPNFWRTGGEGSFQMSQNSISDNWYQGGESTNSVLANIKLFANYNDKEKVQFEGLFEAKAGFNSVSSDTIRQYKINTDLLRLYGKFGLQATHKWYYTISAEFNTQFFKNYKSNSNDIASSFLSPANVIFSVGMDYKLTNNKVNLSIFLSPLAYNFRFVTNDKIADVTAFGIDAGKKSLSTFGSKLQTNASWKIIPSITYDTRLYYFTSYEKVEAEWENSLNFVLNRYLSTKLFVHIRYDDSVARKEGNGYFQMKEFLSFGLNYTW